MMGNTFLPIFVTLGDAQKPNKRNSFANVFPIDDIQTWKNDTQSRTGYVKLSLGLRKLV